MRYVWDPAKDALNQRKHDLSLADGIPALEDPERDISVDGRFDYEEERIVTTGRSGSKVLVVVSTELVWDDIGELVIRIISVRKANWYEADCFNFSRA
jgi:uncharacterized DUF497 family protein